MNKTRKNSLLVTLVCALVLSMSLFFGSASIASADVETLDYEKEINGSVTYSEAFEHSGNLDNIAAEGATYIYLRSDATEGFYTVRDELTLGKKFVSAKAVVSVRCIDYVGDRPANDAMKFWVSADNQNYTEVASLSTGDVSDAFYTYEVDITDYVADKTAVYFKVTFQYAADCQTSHDWVAFSKIALSGKTTLPTEEATDEDYAKAFNGSATYGEAFEHSGNLDNIAAEGATYVYLRSDATEGFYTVRDELTLGRKFINVKAVVSVRCIDYVGDRPANDAMKFWVSTDNQNYTEIASLSTGDVSDAFYAYEVDITDYVADKTAVYFKVTFQYEADCKTSHDWVAFAQIALSGKTTLPIEEATEEEYHSEIVTTAANIESYESTMMDFWTIDGVNYLGVRNDIKGSGKDGYYIYRKQLEDGRTFNKLEIGVSVYCHAWNGVQLKDVMKFWVSADNVTYTEVASLSTDDVDSYQYVKKVDVSEYVAGGDEVFFKISWHFPEDCENDTGWTMFSKIIFDGTTTFPVDEKTEESYSKTVDVSATFEEAHEASDLKVYENMQAGRTYISSADDVNGYYVAKAALEDYRKFLTLTVGVGVNCTTWIGADVEDVMKLLVSTDGVTYTEFATLSTSDLSSRFYKKHFDITEYVKDKFAMQQSAVVYVKVQWNFPAGDTNDHSWISLTQIDFYGTTTLALEKTWNDITYVDEMNSENNNAVYYNDGDEIQLVDLEKVGYTFDGWFENDVKVESILATDTGDRTFTARWTLNQYTIEYQNLKGAENSNALTYTVLDTITFAELELEGYSFNGWFENDVEITSISAGEVGNRVIVAEWVVKNYIISYVDEFNCENTNATVYTIESENINLEGLTKEGYKFLGWYETSDFTGEAITQIPQGSKGNKTLYARWEAVEQEGGESSESESTPSGSESKESSNEGGCGSSIGFGGLFAVLGAAAIAMLSKKRR